MDDITRSNDTARSEFLLDGETSRDGGRGIGFESSPSPAIQGRPRGKVGWSGSSEGAGLARALGWFSVGLGTAQLLAPHGISRLIGLGEGSTGTAWIMRAAGLREIGHGAGILANPGAKEWMGSRVPGDVLDLALLGGALVVSERKDRTLAAAAAVLGVTALDVIATEQLARSRKAPSEDALREPGVHIHKSIIVERPLGEVFDFWSDFENFPRFMRHVESVQTLGKGRSHWMATGPAGTTVEWEAEIVDERRNEVIAWRSVEGSALYTAGLVRFREASGGGTRVTVEMHYEAPGGRLGSALLKLFRKEPGQQVGDDLRRLKQILETGDLVLSDATLEARPRPARPRRPSSSDASSPLRDPWMGSEPVPQSAIHGEGER